MHGVTAYCKEFCDCTTIHGFRYFLEKNRTIFERIWWFATVIISLSFCVVIIYQTYEKWDENAIIITSSNKPIPLYEIPMPAITICPESKIPYYDFDDKLESNEEDIWHNLTSIDKIHFEYVKIICDRVPKNMEKLKKLNFFNDTEYINEKLLHFMDKVKPNFVPKISFPLNVDIDNDIQMTPLITDQGICYSFNILDRSDIYRTNVKHYKNFFKTKISNWSMSNGYSQNAIYSIYPLRADTIFENGLRIEIETSSEDVDYGCKTASPGFRLLLHEPFSVPSLKKNYFTLSLDQNTDIVVKPIPTIASDSVKKYSTKRRNCYFENERNLTYFKKYTLSNCQLECRTNYTLALCDCVEFFMPRVNGTRICRRDHRCYDMVQYLTQNDNILEKIENSVYENSAIAKLKLDKAMKLLGNIRNKNKTMFRCGCLSACAELEYKADSLQSDVDYDRWANSIEIFGSDSASRHYIATVNLQFETNELTALERKELYGPTDFVANFGGLLGLFCGFSILSLIEILYFLTIRIICNKKLFGGWAGPKKSFNHSNNSTTINSKSDAAFKTL